MSVNSLSDLNFDPAVLADSINSESLNQDLLVQSGAVMHVPCLDRFLDLASSPDAVGNIIRLPYQGPLEAIEANISSDDPKAMCTPAKCGSPVSLAVRQSLNNNWPKDEFTQDLKGKDLLGGIIAKVEKFWISHRQERLLAIMEGLMADSVANYGGDLLVDRATTSYINVDPGKLIRDAVIVAAAMWGDKLTESGCLMVHPTVFAIIYKSDAISNFINASYIIQNEGMPVETIDEVTGEGGHPAYKVYYSYLLGKGAFVAGVGSPKCPFKVGRAPADENGAGMEHVYSSVEWVLHPQGYDYELLPTPSVAELKKPEPWKRLWKLRKRVLLTVIRTIGH